jgi:hypothetical protein
MFGHVGRYTVRGEAARAEALGDGLADGHAHDRKRERLGQRRVHRRRAVQFLGQHADAGTFLAGASSV